MNTLKTSIQIGYVNNIYSISLQAQIFKASLVVHYDYALKTIELLPKLNLLNMQTNT